MDEYLSPSDDLRRPALVTPDALTNPQHLKFALKGRLAASLCYAIYNSIAWPGISTSVSICLLTCLSTIGASHQKQVLLFAGTIRGGVVFGMGSQISEGNTDLAGSVEHLDRPIRTCCSGESQEMVAAQFGASLSLSRRIESLTISLDNEIGERLGLLPV